MMDLFGIRILFCQWLEEQCGCVGVCLKSGFCSCVSVLSLHNELPQTLGFKTACIYSLLVSTGQEFGARVSWVFCSEFHHAEIKVLSRAVVSSEFFFFFFFFKIYLIYFLAVLGLCCCMRAFSSCGKQGLLFVAVPWLFILVASCCRAQFCSYLE